MTDKKFSTKICIKCSVEKAISYFRKRKTAKDGLTYWCKDCLSEYQIKKYRESGKCKGNRQQFKELIGMHYIIGKTCPICNSFKERNGYSYSHKTHDLLKQACKKCESKRFKKHRDNNLEEYRKKDRINHYVRKYGLCKDKASGLVKNRIGKCEICKEKKELVVDHCHENGHVRGMICSACNSALGYTRDNIEILENCIKYLIKDSKR